MLCQNSRIARRGMRKIRLLQRKTYNKVPTFVALTFLMGELGIEQVNFKIDK